MKRIYQFFGFLAALALTLNSCDEDELTTLATVTFPSAPVATPDPVVINQDNQYQPVVNLSWPEVTFPVNAPVTYAVYIDVAGDTLGDNAWDNAIRLVAGEDVLSKTLSGDELNDIAHQLGLVSDVAGQLVFRAEATLDRSVFSQASAFTVTPFTEPVAFGQVYVPGNYQGWNPATAATLAAIGTGIYQGFLTFPSGQVEFKFTTGPNWDNTYGLDSSGNLSGNGTTANIFAPAAGSYLITLNLNTMSYTLQPWSWGVIGTATAGGWNTDTDMVWDYQNHVWKFTGPLMNGALKFRLNDGWTINYGPNSNADTSVFLDNPGAYTINVAGTYEVTLDIDATNPPSAPYTVTLL